MAKSDLLQIFEQNDLFQGEQVFPRHAFIKSSGTADRNIYYILSGSVKIGFNSKDGEQIIRLGYAGDFVVVLDSFLTALNSDLFIQTLKETRIKCVEKHDFDNFVHKSIENLNIYNAMLEDLALQLLAREQDLMILSPKERFDRLLIRSPHVFQHIPAKHIAKYLNMSAETLSRLRKP